MVTNLAAKYQFKINSKCGFFLYSAAEVVLAIDWQKFQEDFISHWNSVGEKLLWKTWMEKYKNYIDPDFDYLSLYDSDSGEAEDSTKPVNFETNEVNPWDSEWNNHCQEIYNSEYQSFYFSYEQPKISSIEDNLEQLTLADADNPNLNLEDDKIIVNQTLNSREEAVKFFSDLGLCFGQDLCTEMSKRKIEWDLQDLPKQIKLPANAESLSLDEIIFQSKSNRSYNLEDESSGNRSKFQRIETPSHGIFILYFLVLVHCMPSNSCILI